MRAAWSVLILLDLVTLILFVEMYKLQIFRYALFIYILLLLSLCLWFKYSVQHFVVCRLWILVGTLMFFC